MPPDFVAEGLPLRDLTRRLLSGPGLVLAGSLGSGVPSVFDAVLGALGADGFRVETTGALGPHGLHALAAGNAAEQLDVLGVPACDLLDDDAAGQVASWARTGVLRLLVGCHYSHHRTLKDSPVCQKLPLARTEIPLLSWEQGASRLARAAGAPPSADATSMLSHAAGDRGTLHGVLLRDALDGGLLAVRGGTAVIRDRLVPGTGLLALLEDWKSFLSRDEEKAFDTACLARGAWVPDLVALAGGGAVDALLERGLLTRSGVGVQRVAPATSLLGAAGRRLLGVVKRRELASDARAAGLRMDVVTEALWEVGTSQPPPDGQLVAAAAQAMERGRPGDVTELLAGVRQPRPEIFVLGAAGHAMLGSPRDTRTTDALAFGRLGIPEETPGIRSARTYLRLELHLQDGDFLAAAREAERDRNAKMPAWVWRRASLESTAAGGAVARACAEARAAAGDSASRSDAAFLAILAGELDSAAESLLAQFSAARHDGLVSSASTVGLAAVLVLGGSHRAGMRLLRDVLPQVEAWDPAGSAEAAHALAAYAEALEGRTVAARAFLAQTGAARTGVAPAGASSLSETVGALARISLADARNRHREDRFRAERSAARASGDRNRALVLGTFALAGGLDGAAGPVLEDAELVDGRFASVAAVVGAAILRTEPQPLIEASEVLLDMGHHGLAQATARRARRMGQDDRSPGRLVGEASRRSRARSARIETVVASHLLPASEIGTGRAEASGQPAVLTPRQRDVLDLVRQGLDNTQVAARLGLSVRTVESHLHTIYAKGAAPRRRSGAGVAGRSQRE